MHSWIIKHFLMDVVEYVKFTIPDLHWQYSLSDLLKLQALDSL